MKKGKKGKKGKGKPKPYRAALPLLLLALLVVSGCAGSLGWSNSTALPRGSFREERIDRVGPSSMGCDTGSSFSTQEFRVPQGYMLIPDSRTASPCQ